MCVSVCGLFVWGGWLRCIKGPAQEVERRKVGVKARYKEIMRDRIVMIIIASMFF